jgi:hypothetical protein
VALVVGLGGCTGDNPLFGRSQKGQGGTDSDGSAGSGDESETAFTTGSPTGTTPTEGDSVTSASTSGADETTEDSHSAGEAETQDGSSAYKFYVSTGELLGNWMEGEGDPAELCAQTRIERAPECTESAPMLVRTEGGWDTWFSDGGFDPSLPITDLTGNEMARDLERFVFDGPYAAFLNYEINWNLIEGDPHAWTGMAVFGSDTEPSTCAGWTTTAGLGGATQFGQSGPAWWAGPSTACNVPGRVMCLCKY